MLFKSAPSVKKNNQQKTDKDKTSKKSESLRAAAVMVSTSHFKLNTVINYVKLLKISPEI